MVLDAGIAGEEKKRKTPCLYFKGGIQTVNKSKEEYFIVY